MSFQSKLNPPLCFRRYFRISALLAEITQNSTYIKAAQQSADFLLFRVYTNDSLVPGMVRLNNETCQIHQDEKRNSWSIGYTIEGLSTFLSVRANGTAMERHVALLSHATLTSAHTTCSRLTNSVVASTTYPEWHEGRGIQAVKTNTFGDPNLVRGLSVAGALQSDNANMSTYISSYLSVQYNAVIGLATVPGTNTYGGSWNGPPATNYSAVDQVRAAQVLLTGISLAQDQEGKSPSPSPSPPLPLLEKRTLPITGIVGGVIGGLFVVTAIIVCLLHMNRLRRYRISSSSTDDIQPYPSGLVGEKTGSKKFTPYASQNPHSGDDQTQATTDSSSNLARREITTAELVRMLNQRLQPEHWREDEQLPGYGTSTISLSR
ncbi:hypothetical protein VNI00_008872 [Paramarasmius palmivorus]|uniref:Uncharacterized protein n=1 Tax=Paramarasmius palmivorus TaxID=297713 RepID=A0AAW0CUP3_9AGAR